MYKNLEAELKRQDITREMIANALRINASTVSNKLTKPYRLKLYEAVKIQKAFFPDLELSYLFDYSM